MSLEYREERPRGGIPRPSENSISADTYINALFRQPARAGPSLCGYCICVTSTRLNLHATREAMKYSRRRHGRHATCSRTKQRLVSWHPVSPLRRYHLRFPAPSFFSLFVSSLSLSLSPLFRSSPYPHAPFFLCSLTLFRSTNRDIAWINFDFIARPADR